MRDGGSGGEVEDSFSRNPGMVGGGGEPDKKGVSGAISAGGAGSDGEGALLGRERGAPAAAAAAEEEEKDMALLPKRSKKRGGGVENGESRPAAASSADDDATAAAAATDSGGGKSGGGGGGDKLGGVYPYSAAAAAEAARRRIKRARVALEEAIDELGRSAIDELGLAPPAYMDLDYEFTPPPLDAVKGKEEDGGEEKEDEQEEKVASGEERQRLRWLRQWRKRGGWHLGGVGRSKFFVGVAADAVGVDGGRGGVGEAAAGGGSGR